MFYMREDKISQVALVVKNIKKVRKYIHYEEKNPEEKIRKTIVLLSEL